MVRDTNNDLITPTNLGVLTPSNASDGSLFTTSRADSVSTIDDINDFYTVRLDRNSSLNISLSGLSSGARVDLINNANQSRFGDPGETIQTAFSSGTSLSMQVEGLGAAEYGLRVSTSTGTTNYSLNLSATAGAGREQGITDFLNPQNLGTLSGSRLISGSMNGNTALGGDIQDFYRFRVDVPTKFEASLFAATSATTDFNLFKIDNSNPFSSSSVSVSANVDSMKMDYLPPGEYLIAPRAIGSNTNYTLNMTGTPIARAEASFTVERIKAIDGVVDTFDSPFDPIFGTHKADFFANVSIEGDKKTSKKVNDDDDIQPNFTHTKSVAVNDESISFYLQVRDSDDVFDDEADLNNRTNGTITDFFGFQDAEIRYNPVTDTVQTFTGKFLGRKNQSLEIQGDGIAEQLFTGPIDDPTNFIPAARATFRVDYNTFGFGQTSFSNNTPMTIGTNSSGVTSGRNLGGIVDGRGGKDEVYAKGGDDFAMGGVGNDYVDGGTGDDVVFGGLGKDICVGGKGRDTIVLAPGTGGDVIQGFRNGTDKLGLANAVAFEMLDVFQRGRNTVIGLGGERLAVLKGVLANQIGAEDFVAIDFTSFKGMEVPTVVA